MTAADRKTLLRELDAHRPPVADRVLASLRRKPQTLASLAQSCGAPAAAVRAALKALAAQAYNVRLFGETWVLEEAPPRGGVRVAPYVSRPDGWYCFGFLADSHLGNKHARHDVLHDLYRRFEDAGVDRVFHGGNWIDGEDKRNRYELEVVGLEAQVAHLVDRYPVSTLDTYAVSGDDHEGWYQQREGIDIGRFAESRMRDAGRTNWHHVGYVEAQIPLQHAVTGATERLALVHPGGGSAYAHSYSPQQYVNALEGGEKPAVLLLGHWHKLSLNDLRNVWTIQMGCVEEQTAWARKKRLDFHIGGGVCELWQDPHTGAITRCRVEFFRYYNQAYYTNNRWSHGAPIAQPARTAERPRRT